MAMLKHMLGQFLGRLRIINRDADVGLRHVLRRNQHGHYLRGRQGIENTVVFADRRRDDDPIKTRAAEPLDESGAMLADVFRREVLDHEVVAPIAAGLQGADEQLAEVCV